MERTKTAYGSEGKAIVNDNALKAIAKTDDELVVQNYIALFGGRDLTGIGHKSAAMRAIGDPALMKKNGDGSTGEFFTSQTDFESPYTFKGALDVDWEHGNEEISPDEILGYVDWKTKAIDANGILVKRILNRRNKYVQLLEPLIEAGLVGNSTEAISEMTRRKATGEITQWALKRDTLTVAPFEPRMLTQNALAAVKALKLLNDDALPSDAEATANRAAQTQGADNGNASQQGDNQMSDELKALIDTQSATVAEQGKQIKTLSDAVAETNKTLGTVVEALKKEPPANSGTNVTVVLDEADRPFKSLAEQCLAVKSFVITRGERLDPRLKRLSETKAASGATVGVSSEGAFLVEPTLMPDLLKPMHDVGQFSSRVRRLPVGTNSNYGWLNGVDETSRVAGSRWGGIRGYRLAEGNAPTSSKPAFRRINWELKKYGVLVYATDELLADAAQFSEVVRMGAAEELMFLVNDDILNGDGAAGALGIMQSGAKIQVTRNTASHFYNEDVTAMWARLDSRSKGNAVWFIHRDLTPEIDTMFLTAGTGGLEPRFVTYGPDGVMRIKGAPVVETEYNQTLGTSGDVVLADMSQYLFWEKGGAQSAESIHVLFTTDETTFRFIYRCDGKTAAASPLTPYHGSNTTSPFIVLS